MERYQEPCDQSTARTVQCDSWDSFITAVRARREYDGSHERIFRGHGDASWKLASEWQRFLIHKKQEGDQTDAADVLERKLLSFKEHATGLPEVRESALKSDNDWWALGRHHGLVTPLLDWTRSPYVAAYFAWIGYFEQRNDRLALWGGTPQRWGDGSVAVWELGGFDQLTNDELHVFASRTDAARRQKAQQGLLTILRHATHLDLQSYLESRGLASRLTKYVIPGTAFPTALADLTAMNLSHATLFPDLDGAARQANFDAVATLFSVIQGLQRTDGVKHGARPAPQAPDSPDPV